MPETTEGIDYFGRGSMLTKLQERLSVKARREMFESWATFAERLERATLLDVGSTPDRERQDSNCMLPWFNERGVDLSLYSPEDIQGLRDTFPYAKIVPSAGFNEPIPVADRVFDWTAASAVLEHVGGREQQVAFVRECARVANGLFLTTPNRWHWLEFHTKLPLIHWLPRNTHRALLRGLGKGLWAEESHLRLLDESELQAVAQEAIGDTFRFEIRTVSALGMPSNLVLLAKRLG
jgi:hypothetical protein